METFNNIEKAINDIHNDVLCNIDQLYNMEEVFTHDHIITPRYTTLSAVDDDGMNTTSSRSWDIDIEDNALTQAYEKSGDLKIVCHKKNEEIVKTNFVYKLYLRDVEKRLETLIIDFNVCKRQENNARAVIDDDKPWDKIQKILKEAIAITNQKNDLLECKPYKLYGQAVKVWKPNILYDIVNVPQGMDITTATYAIRRLVNNPQKTLYHDDTDEKDLIIVIRQPTDLPHALILNEHKDCQSDFITCDLHYNGDINNIATNNNKENCNTLIKVENPEYDIHITNIKLDVKR